MGSFFLIFVLPQLIAWLLAWKRILKPIAILTFILGVAFYKLTGGYIDVLIISMELAFVGLGYEMIKSA